jgi:hypothetical protein
MKKKTKKSKAKKKLHASITTVSELQNRTAPEMHQLL